MGTCRLTRCLCHSWCPWEAFNADNLLLLYRKQRKMKWLEVMDLDRNVLSDLKKKADVKENLFKHARKLALYPENRSTLELCSFFVEKTTEQLEELIIHANFDFHDRDHSPPPPNGGGSALDNRELNDTATGPGLLSRTIFRHMTPFDKCTPFQNLTSLRLHRVSLRHCADTWCKVVDFNRLVYLRLYSCSGADTLFGQLCKASHLPKKLRVLEFQHKDNSDNEALIALDGFLCLVSGIRDLIVDLENVKALPGAAGIVRHSKTLELLNVHVSNDPSLVSNVDGEAEELVWGLEDFEKICKACTQLEQLSCAWPPTSLIRSPSESWKSYEGAVGENLKHLVTLHISTFPTNKPSTQLLPRAIYEQLLQGLATRVFDLVINGSGKSEASTSTAAEIDGAADNDSDTTDTVPSSAEIKRRPGRLRLLAFGISDKIYEREESKNQLIYLRSSCKSALGEEKMYAAPVAWCLRQFVEPVSEVLDFVLHRETRVPCREREGLGHGTGGWGGVGDDDE